MPSGFEIVFHVKLGGVRRKLVALGGESHVLREDRLILRPALGLQSALFLPL